jgi:hypothetical protein
MKNLTISEIKKIIDKNSLHPAINAGHINGCPATKLWSEPLNDYIVIVDYPNKIKP